MRRYAGEGLGRSPRIAVVTNDALGNFIVATPLMQMLRSRHDPSSLDYFGGERIRELAEPSDLFERFVPLYGSEPRSLLGSIGEPYDLVVNIEVTSMAKCASAMLAGEEGFVCGPCIDEEGRKDLAFEDGPRGLLWEDQNWIAEDLTKKYPFLDSGFIGEIFCRLAYLEGDVPSYRLASEEPGREVPDVIVSCSASLEEKLWPDEKWIAFGKAMTDGGLSIGVVGAKPSEQGKYWKGAGAENALIENGATDLRGALSIPQVIGALGAAKAVVSIDNGVLHMASSTGTPVVGLYRNGIHRLWAPPREGLAVIEPGEGTVASIPAETVINTTIGSI